MYVMALSSSILRKKGVRAKTKNTLSLLRSLLLGRTLYWSTMQGPVRSGNEGLRLS